MDIMEKKAISPVVSTALLLVVAVIAVVGFGNWFGNFQSNINSDIEDNSNNINSNKLTIDTLVGDNLYLNNKGNKNSTINSIRINGIDCEVNQNISGIEPVDLSTCLKEFPNQKVKILVQTNKGIIKKTLYNQKINTNDDILSSTELAFVTVWNTSISAGTNDNQIKLPLINLEGNYYDFKVYWGDGTSDIITIWNQSETTHTYSSPGEYEVTITGDIKGFRFNGRDDAKKIIDIKSWGQVNLGIGGAYFYGCENLVGTFTDTLNLTGTTYLHYMFMNNYKFNGDVSNWNVSEVGYMQNMFKYARVFNRDISKWDVGKVRNMGDMFSGASVFNADISQWDTHRASSFSGMFTNAKEFNQDISGWNTISVYDMTSMFYGATKFNQNISGWDTLGVGRMAYMFKDATSFNQDLSSWRTDDVTSINSMFAGATSFNSDISSWNTKKVQYIQNMFDGATKFNQNLSSWNTSSVSNSDNFNTSTPSWSLPKPTFNS